jgi:transcriptional regulator GlxA family with amidase domain
MKLPTNRKYRLTNSEIKLITEYLQTNFHKNLSLFSMASQVNKSTVHFGRCFLGTFGQTPCDYLKDLRLNKAAQLLMVNPAIKIEEVACHVGLNITSFRRLFRLKFGTSASSYQNSWLRCN